MFKRPTGFEAEALHIMLRDLLTQKYAQKFLVTDFGYPRACRFLGTEMLLYIFFHIGIGKVRKFAQPDL
jgi:hypothetical protein